MKNIGWLKRWRIATEILFKSAKVSVFQENVERLSMRKVAIIANYCGFGLSCGANIDVCLDLLVAFFTGICFEYEDVG